MLLLNRALSATPVLISALGAIGLALLFIDRGWIPVVIVVVSIGAGILAAYGLGRIVFSQHPRLGGWLMEAGLLFGTLGAAIAGAAVLWLLVEQAPGEDASTRTKETFAALSGAVSAFFGALVIKPDGILFNPLRRPIERTFAKKFQRRRNDLEKDAHNAATDPHYSPQAPEHAGQVVDGWDWTSRRRRARHVSDGLRDWTP